MELDSSGSKISRALQIWNSRRRVRKLLVSVMGQDVVHFDLQQTDER